MQYLAAYVAACLVFFALDMIWLAGVAKNFYFTALAGLVRERADIAVAGVFYLGYVAGVVFFAVAPALNGGGLSRAILNGALLGLLAYGTYDLTNLATLKGFPVKVAIVDMTWGVFLTTTTAVAGYLAATRLSG